MPRITLNENDDLADICYDGVFKAVFTKDTPASRGALSRLISALIGRDVSVKTINTNEPAIDNTHDRQIRFDISCKAVSGELINVEMSLDPAKFEPVRLEYYEGKLFTGQGIRGTRMSYSNLKEAYQIAILARERLFPDDEFFHRFEYYDPERRISLNGKSRIITLELSKVEKAAEKPTEEMSARECWGVYFRYLTDKRKRWKINEIMEAEEGIAMASEELITITQDERERAWELSRLKYELDKQSWEAEAWEEGLAEGKLEIARNALHEGATVEFVQKITGLDPETIKGL